MSVELSVAQKRILALLAGKCRTFRNSPDFLPAIEKFKPNGDGYEARTLETLRRKGFIAENSDGTFSITAAGRQAFGSRDYNPGW
jgi:hypothetical protein